MNKNFITTALVLSILSLAPAVSMAAVSAAINLSPLTGSYKVGQTFDVTISVNPDSENIDMVRAKLIFPPDLLQIKNFSLGSAFSYPAGGNAFDNTAGTFSWGAGTPGGITTLSNFGTITFTVKKAGDAVIAVSKDSLALSAGVNNFNGQLNSTSYTLSEPIAAPKPAAKKTQPAAVQPAAAQPFENTNAVQTQIISKIPSQNLGASLLGSLPFQMTFKTWLILGIVLVAILMGFGLYKIVVRPALNVKDKN